MGCMCVGELKVTADYTPSLCLFLSAWALKLSAMAQNYQGNCTAQKCWAPSVLAALRLVLSGEWLLVALLWGYRGAAVGPRSHYTKIQYIFYALLDLGDAVPGHCHYLPWSTGRAAFLPPSGFCLHLTAALVFLWDSAMRPDSDFSNSGAKLEIIEINDFTLHLPQHN